MDVVASRTPSAFAFRDRRDAGPAARSWAFGERPRAFAAGDRKSSAYSADDGSATPSRSTRTGPEEGLPPRRLAVKLLLSLLLGLTNLYLKFRAWNRHAAKPNVHWKRTPAGKTNWDYSTSRLPGRKPLLIPLPTGPEQAHRGPATTGLVLSPCRW